MVTISAPLHHPLHHPLLRRPQAAVVTAVICLNPSQRRSLREKAPPTVISDNNNGCTISDAMHIVGTLSDDSNRKSFSLPNITRSLSDSSLQPMREERKHLPYQHNCTDDEVQHDDEWSCPGMIDTKTATSDARMSPIRLRKSQRKTGMTARRRRLARLTANPSFSRGRWDTVATAAITATTTTTSRQEERDEGELHASLGLGDLIVDGLMTQLQERRASRPTLVTLQRFPWESDSSTCSSGSLYTTTHNESTCTVRANTQIPKNA